MSGIVFPDLMGTLGKAAAFENASAQRDWLDEDRKAKAEIAPLIPKALAGDKEALNQIGTRHPDTFTKLLPMLERMDVATRTRAKEATDWTTRAAMGVLSLPENERPAAYQAALADGQRLGYQIDMPPQYDRAVEGRLKHILNQARPIADYWKSQDDGVTYAAPGGGGGASAPGGFTGQVAKDESGGNYNIPNAKGSGAYGKYQFMPDTWASVAQANPQLNLPMNMRQATPQQQEAAMEAFTRANGQALQQAGQPATAANLYLAHRFGTQGATKFLSMPDNTPISAVFPPKWIEQNPDLNTTVGQFKRSVQSRYGGMPVGREVDIATNAVPMPQPPAGLTPPGPPPAQMPDGPPGLAIGSDMPRGDGSGNALPPQGQEIPREATRGMQLPPGYQVGMQRGKIFSPVPGYIQVMPPGGGAPILWPVPQVKEKQAPAGYRFAPDGSSLHVIPGGPADKAQGTGPFAGNSVEAQALNMMIANGTLTPQQAAELAAGKTVTDPETKQIIFMTPSGIFGQRPGQAPQPLSGPPAQAAPSPQSGAPIAPAPGGAPAPLPAGAPANPGAIPLTGTKPTGQASATEIAKLRTARAEAEKITAAANDFKAEWAKASPMDRARALSGANTPLNAAYNNFALLAKGDALFQLGVLNGPDLDIIRRTISDPSTWKSVMTTENDVTSSVDKVLNILNTGISATEKQLGIAPPAQPQGAKPGTYMGPDNKPISWQEIETTAKNRGITPDEVVRKLGLKPTGMQ